MKQQKKMIFELSGRDNKFLPGLSMLLRILPKNVAALKHIQIFSISNYLEFKESNYNTHDFGIISNKNIWLRLPGPSKWKNYYRKIISM